MAVPGVRRVAAGIRGVVIEGVRPSVSGIERNAWLLVACSTCRLFSSGRIVLIDYIMMLEYWLCIDMALNKYLPENN